MKHFLCPFYLACIIVLIKTKEDFLSSKTLKVGEPLEVRCNFFVFGNNAPIIKCAYAAALLKSDETNTTLLPLADLPIKSNKKTYLNPWWTASFGDYNNEDCGSLENITITASTTAVRIEDSGTYMCTMNVHNSNGSFFMQIFTINETLTVLPSVTTTPSSGARDTSTNMFTFLVMAIIVYMWHGVW